MSSIADSNFRDELRIPSFSTLPTEIISEIFVSCLPFYLERRSTLNPNHAPMLLLCVCRKWRSIALSTPRLWALVNLDFDCLAQPFFEKRSWEKFLEDCVTRAGACPFSLRLKKGYKLEQDGWRFIPTILEQHSGRIQELELMVDLGQYPKYTSGFPLLQKLKINLPAEYDDEDPEIIALKENPIQIFAAAPQLRQLDLTYVTPSLFAIRWENLAEFTAFGISSSDCVDVLRWAPSLVRCTISSPYLEPDTTAVSHPNLKSFTFSEMFTTERIFRFLTFPTLEYLNLFMKDMDDAHFLQFVSRSSSSLLRLTSRFAAVPLESLSNMVALTRLTLYAPSREYLVEFFDHFDRTKNPAFLPQLKMLAFKDCLLFVNQLLIDALSSRCSVTQDGGVILQSFCQVWSENRVVDTLYDLFDLEGYVPAVFDKLVDAGMDIYVGPAVRSSYL
ncbi:F-box domain-containing protein [Mycena sanguinolenta]|uniref:F-box domain-containing protein n=1 Tax=Mycena sanguinolenta TaxID=230812 RepID=A0A8H6X6A2_9AGAR|nr:F-box domain-containing protein [Mycena sanguinolenta]